MVTRQQPGRAVDFSTVKLVVYVWLGLITLLWGLHPLLFAPVRAVVVLAIVTTLFGLLGWLTPWSVLAVWSGGVGLCNITLALLLSAYPPSLWVGLSSGCLLFAFLDGSHHFTYLRYCQVEPGVLSMLLRAFLRLSGLSLAIGLLLGLLLTTLPHQWTGVSMAGMLTILGAAVFVGFLALFLLSAARQGER